MSIHSSVLAWRIPGTAETGGLPSMGSHRVRQDWSDLAAAAYSIYNVSGIQQSDSVSHAHKHICTFSDSFSLQVITRHWITFPVLYSRSLLFIHFIYRSVHLLIPKTWLISPQRGLVCCSLWGRKVSDMIGRLKTSPLVTMSLISRSVSLFLFCNRVHLYNFWNFYLLICYFWLCWVFVAMHGLCLAEASRATLQLQCMGFSLQWPLLLWSMGSRCWVSVVVTYGLSFPAACGIFLDQQWKKCPLLWQADS